MVIYLINTVLVLLRLFGIYYFLIHTLPRMREEWKIESNGLKKLKLNLFLCGMTSLVCVLILTAYYIYVSFFTMPDFNPIGTFVSAILSLDLFVWGYSWYLIYKKQNTEVRRGNRPHLDTDE